MCVCVFVCSTDPLTERERAGAHGGRKELSIWKGLAFSNPDPLVTRRALGQGKRGHLGTDLLARDKTSFSENLVVFDMFIKQMCFCCASYKVGDLNP